MKKTESAAQTIRELNPDVTRRPPRGDARPRTTSTGSSRATTSILDGTDTFETRYTLNDAAVRARHPRRARLGLPLRGPADACSSRTRAPATAASIPTPPPPELAPGCSVAGVLGVVPGVMGLLQATEAHQGAARHRRLRWPAGCSSTTPWTARSASCSCGATRTAPPAATACCRCRSEATTASSPSLTPAPWRRTHDRGPHPARAAGTGRQPEAGRGEPAPRSARPSIRCSPSSRPARAGAHAATAASTASSTSTSTAATCATSRSWRRRSAPRTRSSCCRPWPEAG